jgi:hypothetical protein
MKFQKLSISVLVLGAACAPASATTIYCSNGCSSNNTAAFNSATTSFSFPNAPILFSNASGGPEYTDPVSLTEFTEYLSPGTSIDTNGFDGFSGIGNLKTDVGGDLIEVTLPANVYAFGANLQTPSGAATVCIEPTSTPGSANCNATVATTGSSDTEFIGVVSATPITTVWLAPGQNSTTIQLDNFEIGEQSEAPPADTPEIATMLMIGTGLISLGVMRRRSAGVR